MQYGRRIPGDVPQNKLNNKIIKYLQIVELKMYLNKITKSENLGTPHEIIVPAKFLDSSIHFMFLYHFDFNTHPAFSLH